MTLCKHYLILLVLLSQTQSVFGVLSVYLENIDAACGNNNGHIQAFPSGGTAPYSYLWSSGQVVSSIDNLAPGIYTVTVTDAIGGTATATATIINTAIFAKLTPKLPIFLRLFKQLRLTQTSNFA